MSGRGRSSFTKRLKERSRQENSARKLNAKSNESWRNLQLDPILLNFQKKISQPRPHRWPFRGTPGRDSRKINSDYGKRGHKSRFSIFGASATPGKMNPSGRDEV